MENFQPVSVSRGPEEEVAARLGVSPLEGTGPEDPPRVGPHLVHLPLPASPVTPTQRGRGRDVADRGRGREELGAVITSVIETGGIFRSQKSAQF